MPSDLGLRGFIRSQVDRCRPPFPVLANCLVLTAVLTEGQKELDALTLYVGELTPASTGERRTVTDVSSTEGILDTLLSF
jgi:hypothetical protein